MIYVDPRIGSGDLAPLLSSLGCPVEVQHLDFADCMFLGNGPDGAPTPIGVEVKKLNDVLQCITSGRFLGHQLPGLLRDYEHVWLVVEGLYRANPVDGTLEIRLGRDWRPVGHGKQQWMFSAFDKWLTKLEVKANVHVRRTANRDETARTVGALYNWWQDSDSHSLDQLDRTAQIALETHVANSKQHEGMWLGQRVKPTLARRFAAELPGIGIRMSGGVATHFGSVRTMVNAEEREWLRIPGIGKTLARRIVSEINESQGD